MALKNNTRSIGNISATSIAGSEAYGISKLRLLVNLYSDEGQDIDNLSGVPTGYNMGALLLPLKTGGMRLFGEATGTGAAIMAGGRAIVADGAATSVGLVNAGAIVPIVADGTATSVGVVTMAGAAAILADSTATSSGSVVMGGIINILEATGVASGSGVCNLTAIGWVTAEGGGAPELSPEGLAASLWGALGTDYNDPGTMGELLNNAGGSVSPTITADAVWSRAASSVTTTGSMGEQLKKAKKAAENAFAVSS